jgi:hypothetical protein
MIVLEVLVNAGMDLAPLASGIIQSVKELAHDIGGSCKYYKKFTSFDDVYPSVLYFAQAIVTLFLLQFVLLQLVV